MKRTLCLLMVLLWVRIAAAEPVPMSAVNLGFDQWDNGAPAGWTVRPAGFKASRDCAEPAHCVLRLESTDAYVAGSFLPVSQRIGAGAAAGHRLTLSGRIRTDKVEGGVAALWLRADAQSGPSLGLDNMRNRAPSGTSAWAPFSVTIGVPRNAASIVLGVLLSGKGTAWFDDLKLSVDTSVDVADAVAPVRKPVRPAPSHELLSDAALRLAPVDVATASAGWRADVARRVHPIRSLYSDDFSDLQFLKPLLAGKRVVQLGESGHGVAEFSLAKVRLIKFLHQQMGYDVIAFESSLPQCYLADRTIGAAPPVDVMRQCLFGVWHSNETLALFDYLDAARKDGKRLSLAGFDIQDSAPSPGAPALLGELLARAGWPRAVELPANEVALFKYKTQTPLAPDQVAQLVAYYGEAAGALEAGRARLLDTGTDRERLEVAIQSAKSRVQLARQYAGAGMRASFESRDRGMADNLDFLLDTQYRGRKVIVWAHNSHISYQRPRGSAKMMGEFVAERRKAEVYTVGLFMGRGAAADNSRRRYDIEAPAADTFDAVMTHGGARFAFVDFSSAGPGPDTGWMFSPIVMRHAGKNPEVMTPAGGYDGVLYIDTVTPPDYR
jgi:erythromycin esterase